MAEEQKEPKVEEFMEIGGSPIPELTLRHFCASLASLMLGRQMKEFSHQGRHQ